MWRTTRPSVVISGSGEKWRGPGGPRTCPTLGRRALHVVRTVWRTGGDVLVSQQNEDEQRLDRRQIVAGAVVSAQRAMHAALLVTVGRLRRRGILMAGDARSHDRTNLLTTGNAYGARLSEASKRQLHDEQSRQGERNERARRSWASLTRHDRQCYCFASTGQWFLANNARNRLVCCISATVLPTTRIRSIATVSMGGVSRVRMWSRRVILAMALMLWALGSMLATPQRGESAGLSESHICTPSTDGSGAPPAHHHCAACLVCSFRDLAHIASAPGEPLFTFEPRYSVTVQWTEDADTNEHRRDLIAQRPRAPPAFS